MVADLLTRQEKRYRWPGRAAGLGGLAIAECVIMHYPETFIDTNNLTLLV